MNEFVAHIIKKTEANEEAIRKLIRKNKKTGFLIGILVGLSVYQVSKISDLQYEVYQLKKKVDEQEPTIINNYESL